MLAESLGKTREELLNSISSSELTLWMAEYRIRRREEKKQMNESKKGSKSAKRR